MTFLRPDLLALTPAIVLVLAVAVVAQWRRGVRLVDAYGGASAAARLTGRRLQRFPAARLGALLVAAVALAIAAAGPQPEQAEPPPPPIPIDLVLAIDISQSMTADDVDGTRIGRARRVVESLVEEAVADRLALSLFAEWSYALVPLTDDERVVTFFAPWVAPDLLSLRDQGTSLATLVGDARSTLEARARSSALPVVLIVSDGEVHAGGAAALDSVAALAQTGVQVWTAAVGTPSGAPLLVSGSGNAPLLDDRGEPVVAGYDPDLLRAMAERGDGRFHEIGDDAGVRALVSDLRALAGTAPQSVVDVADPVGWLLLLGLLLLAVDATLDAGPRRRGRTTPEPVGGPS